MMKFKNKNYIVRRQYFPPYPFNSYDSNRSLVPYETFKKTEETEQPSEKYFIGPMA